MPLQNRAGTGHTEDDESRLASRGLVLKGKPWLTAHFCFKPAQTSSSANRNSCTRDHSPTPYQLNRLYALAVDYLDTWDTMNSSR